ncbi:hypothetical protein KC726_03170 [Candidatus Woesebacteria bacterium]|nr:hypothetical protein [Candidatus Woesebacteria bacterium]
MKKTAFSFFVFALFLFVFVTSIYATSGCCSWHGGVAGCDTSVGRQICNDGTYSPTCTCSYIPHVATPTPINIPTSIKGIVTFDYDSSTKSYTVRYDWDDWSESNGWSIGLSKYFGTDPGPIADTTESKWIFKGVSSGDKYINLKAYVAGHWSNITSKSIHVPVIPSATSKPTPTNKPIVQPKESKPTPKPVKQESTTNKAKKKSLWELVFGF